ncbi:MAG: hypothetical protein N2381_07715, partial [Armatimonadetes bacterium]|nr:hypothetical protein [Armatimonadota bacterium]
MSLIMLNGCGGNLNQQISIGVLTVIFHFPPKGYITPETDRVRVQVSVEGLTQPLEQVAERPSQDGGEVRVTFSDVPIGNKTVKAIAEN